MSPTRSHTPHRGFGGKAGSLPGECDVFRVAAHATGVIDLNDYARIAGPWHRHPFATGSMDITPWSPCKGRFVSGRTSLLAVSLTTPPILLAS
jgi:hypothetical protein